MDLGAVLRAQYDVLVEAFAGLDPDGPTDCAGWTVADLETHVTITARGLARTAANPVGGKPTGGVAAWTEVVPDFAETVDGLTKSERLHLADHVDAAARALDGDLDVVIEQITGRHTLRDAGVFRLVEAVVHGLDAGIAPVPEALRLVTKELAKALAARHPGKSVEVRVPPYAAVQCLEGPRHTRGTPPNVVETDAVTFLRLVCGRERWADVARAGRLSASGERSDLSGILPLLG